MGNMMPDIVTALLAKELTALPAISSKPTNNELTRIRATLAPVFLTIPYKENAVAHNSIGFVMCPVAYRTKYGVAFAIPL